MWDFSKTFSGQNLNCRCFLRLQIVSSTKTGFNWILGLKRDLVFQRKLTDATSWFFTDLEMSLYGR